jgi:hypothetical protein
MVSRNCIIGSSQGKSEGRVPMAQQGIRSAVPRRRVVFPSAAEEVAVVETPCLQLVQRVQARETNASL